MANRGVLMPPAGSDVAAAAGTDPLSPVPLTSRDHYLHTLTLCVAQDLRTLKWFAPHSSRIAFFIFFKKKSKELYDDVVECLNSAPISPEVGLCILYVALVSHYLVYSACVESAVVSCDHTTLDGPNLGL